MVVARGLYLARHLFPLYRGPKGRIRKTSHRNFWGRGNTSLNHRTDVDDDTCFFLHLRGSFLAISMMITKSCPRWFWSRELLGGDVTVNGGFETLLLLKLLILGALHDALVVLFCKLMACYENRTCRKGKRGKKVQDTLNPHNVILQKVKIDDMKV